MKFRLAIQPRAEREIAEMARWILETSKNSRIAVGWVDKIQATIGTLKTLPFRCPVDPESTAFGREVRVLMHGKQGRRFRILFVVVNDEVRILAVQRASRPEPIDVDDFD